jgi:pyroglutamyl-peptidase
VCDNVFDNTAMISRQSTGKPSALPRILLTGFEPFGGESINPSWLLAESLHDVAIGSARVHAVRLPTEFGRSAQELRQALRAVAPRWVVCLGQAGGRSSISFERVAINCDEASIADNAGRQPIGPISPRGPVAYWSSLPIHAMADACEQAGVPAQVSNTAGTFVCNHVFYALMRTLALAGARTRKRAEPKTIGGFVHVPYLPEQGAPSLPLDAMRRGLMAALHAAVNSTGAAQAHTHTAYRGTTH